MRPISFKKPLLSLNAIAMACLLSSCSDTTLGTKSFEETESFKIPFIPSPIPLSGITLPTIGIDIGLAAQEAYQDGDFDFVTSVNLSSITFEISPGSNDPAIDTNEDGNLDSFEFVSALEISMRADGGEPVLIATLPDSDPQIASNTDTLRMVVERDEDIRDLIEGDNPTLLVDITGAIPPDAVMVNASIRFRVGIGFR